MTDKISLQKFFDPDMKITSIEEDSEKLIIKIKSKTKSAPCPVCGEKSDYHQVTYQRTIDDLPLFGKPVQLIITAYKYKCFNNKCKQKIFSEDLHGFAGKFRRRSERCEDLVAAIGLNTNCESAAFICSYMGIQISGDTVIRILLKKYENSTENTSSDVIGVDDWAYKKGHTYGTVICDGQTNNPITILEGRDGSELKKWLRNNQHIKTVTRDRAGAYAAAITEIIPEAIQVADRFHLFHNFMHVIKHVINISLPEKIDITPNITEKNISDTSTEKNPKKNFN